MPTFVRAAAHDARAALRQQYRARRRALVGEARRLAEAAITDVIIQSRWFVSAPLVAMYRAFDGEVDLTAVEAAARRADKTVAFARMAGRDAPLEFVVPGAWSRHGRLPVPSGASISPGAGDLVLVPGVAFDEVGGRLGLGGGYYDRTLPCTRAVAVGVGFECQRVASLPRAPWDAPVAALITESGVHAFDIEESRV